MLTGYIFTSIILFIAFLSCSEKKAEHNPEATFSCTENSWSDVERIVQPFVSEEMFTSLVMQAQSSEYNVSAAADHALGISDSYPDSVISMLKLIQKLDC